MKFVEKIEFACLAVGGFLIVADLLYLIEYSVTWLTLDAFRGRASGLNNQLFIGGVILAVGLVCRAWRRKSLSQEKDRAGRSAEIRGKAEPAYTVMIYDNFNWRDDPVLHGRFQSEAEAVAACRRIVIEDLDNSYKQGMSADQLNKIYTMFGSEPVVVAAAGQKQVAFSARDYAEEQSERIAGPGHTG